MKNKPNMNYWEKHYRQGGISGKGSIGKHRDWKWQTINKYIPEINSLVDVGCGDLSFQEGHDYEKYIGIDISQTCIKLNKKMKPHWKFRQSSADKYLKGVKGDVVFCHDLLFHILDEKIYTGILDNLMEYSDKYISIFTWHETPLKKFGIIKKDTDDIYQKYRDFSSYKYRFTKNNFDLICEEKSTVNKYGTLYIFEKVE